MHKEIFQENWNWQQGYLPEVRRILTAHVLSFVSVNVATPYQDLNQATDMVVTLEGRRTIAVRLRRAHYTFRDLTLRAYNKNSTSPTELQKIRAGYADIYLYGWTEGFRIAEWMLVDLNRLRASGLLNQSHRVQYNTDGGTGFVSLAYRDLKRLNCLIAERIN